MKGYNAHEVKLLAQNQWKFIFLQLAPELKEAIEHAGHHVACPVHGGGDGFRLFPRFNVKGDGICNTCGAKTNGISMLMWVNHWTFSEAVNAVGRLLSAPLCHQGEMETIKPQSFEAYFQGFYKRQANKGDIGIYLSKTKKSDEMPDKSAFFVLYGADLVRACQGLRINDYVQVTRFARQKLVIRGRVVHKALWTVKIIATPEERLRKEHQVEELRQARIAHRIQAIDKTWQETVIVSDEKKEAQPVLRYFANRSIACILDADNVRCSAQLPFFEKGKVVGDFPALVCAVRDSHGRVVSLHRTYLTSTGEKAKVKDPKKLMAVPDDRTIKGAAICLVQTSKHVIGIAEGVETALSVVTATGLACWSVISEGGMRHFEPPKGIRFVHIFADKDRSGVGQDAAKVLQARLQSMGIGSRIYLPKEPIPDDAKGIDWNDVLQMGGRFPRFV